MNRREFINSAVACGAVAIVPLCDAAETKEGAKRPVKVTKGMDVVDKIAQVKTGNVGYFSDVPVEPVVSRNVTIAER